MTVVFTSGVEKYATFLFLLTMFNCTMVFTKTFTKNNDVCFYLKGKLGSYLVHLAL